MHIAKSGDFLGAQCALQLSDVNVVAYAVPVCPAAVAELLPTFHWIID